MGINDKCDRIFDDVVNQREHYDLFVLAQCFLDGYDPDKLRQLLRSEDVNVVSDGLFVLSEVGDLARGYAADIELLLRSNDADVQRQAAELARLYLRPRT